MINQGEMEEGEFDTRLGDFIEDAVIWIEMVQIDEKERSQASDRVMHLEWREHRGSYMSSQSIGNARLVQWKRGGCLSPRGGQEWKILQSGKGGS